MKPIIIYNIFETKEEAQVAHDYDLEKYNSAMPASDDLEVLSVISETKDGKHCYPRCAFTDKKYNTIIWEPNLIKK